MKVWIVMYQVGWDGLETIEEVFSKEEDAEDFVKQKIRPHQYEINEHDVA